MSGGIQKSGLLRSAYRMQIGEGAQDTRKAGLTEQALSQLVAKARDKWPGKAFEFRLIEKEGATYLEVLRQKQSTLSKDGKTDYQRAHSPPAALQERDARRLQAVRLLSDRFNVGVLTQAGSPTPEQKVPHNAFLLRQGPGLAQQDPGALPDAAQFFATDAQRGVHAGLFFKLIDQELATRADQRTSALDEGETLPAGPNGLLAGPPPAPAQPPVGQAPEPELPELGDDLFAQGGAADRFAPRHQRREQAGVTAPALQQLHQQAEQSLAQALQPPPSAPASTALLLSNGKRALRMTEPAAGPEGKPVARYFNLDKLQRINAKGAYRPPAPRDRAAQHIDVLCKKAGISWQATQALHQGMQRAEQAFRQKLSPHAMGPQSLGELWTGRALQRALAQHTQPVTEGLRQRLQARLGEFASAAQQDEQLASISAQGLMTDLVTTEHLIAASPDPQARQPLVVLHQQLADKLLAYLQAADPDNPAGLKDMGEHLQAAREAADRWAGARALSHFAIDVDKLRLKSEQRVLKARERLDEAVQRQKTLTEAQDGLRKARPLLDEARLNIQARAQMMAGRVRQARAGGESAALRQLRNPLHKTEVPPKDLSDSPDWQELCAYAEAVNKLRSAGRAGFEGYSGEERIPDKVVAEKFALTTEYDPMVATKIISTMRQLMESGANSSGKAPLQVYVPGASLSSPWMQWTPQDISGMDEKALRVAMSQLLELEFMIAHNASASPYTSLQLLALHQHIAGAVQDALKSNVESKGQAVLAWVGGSSKRVADLQKQAQANIGRADPLAAATMDRAFALRSQAVNEQLSQRLARAERQAAQADSELSQLGQAVGTMEMDFVPRSTDQALGQLLSEDAGQGQAAASHLMRELGGAGGLSGAERMHLAGRLADRLIQATHQQRATVPAPLRLLAASAPGEQGQSLAILEGPRLKQALQALHADLSPNEEARPATLFDRGRLVTQAEMKRHVQEAVDEQQLAVQFLTKEDDAQASDETVMGQRFAQAVREHFSQDGQTRPLVALFLARELGHWVSLVAERQADGGVSCLAVDTDAKSTASATWIDKVRAGLERPAQLGQAGHSQPLGQAIRLSTATASLQERRAPNACGPLQARMVKALQGRKPGSSAIEQAKKWIAKGADLSPDDEAALWQVSAERAELLGAALQDGLAQVREDQRSADRLQDRFSDQVNYQLAEIDQMLSQARQPGDEQAWAQMQQEAGQRLDGVSALVSQYRRELGQLQLFDEAGGPIDSLQGRSEIAQTQLALALQRMRLPAPDRAEGLSQWQEVEDNAEHSQDAAMLEQLEQTRQALQQEWGLELLPAQTRKAQAQERTAADASIRAWNSEGREQDMPALAANMLPDLSSHNGHYEPAELSAYLQRFAQRADGAAVLARAAGKLADIRSDDLASQQAWRHQAHQLWSALADNPWSSAQLGAEARQAMQTYAPSAAPLEFEDDRLNTTVIVEGPQAQARRRELDTLILQQGLIEPQIQPPPKAQAPIEPQPAAPDLQVVEMDFDPIAAAGPAQRRQALAGAMIESPPVASQPRLSKEDLNDLRQARGRMATAELLSKNKQKQAQGWFEGKWLRLDNKDTKVSDYCNKRDLTLMAELFGEAGSGGGGFMSIFSGPPTLDTLKTLPELDNPSQLLSNPQSLWKLGELMLLQKLRGGKSSEVAQKVYNKYLQPALRKIADTPAASSDTASLSYRQKEAAQYIQDQYDRWVAPPQPKSKPAPKAQPLEQSVYETPKIMAQHARDNY